MLSRKQIITASLLIAALTATADDTAVDYRPNIHGTFRGRWEMLTGDGMGGESRFQVRNARVSVDGKVATWADYFLQTDLCDQGKMKILDAYARVRPAKGVALRAGQFRMPFGTDPFRGPDKYYFANRSFIGKQVCNVRGVGFEGAYTLPSTPLDIKVAAFNPGGIADHSGWHRSMAYAGKLQWRVSGLTIAAGAMSMKPTDIRINLTGGSIGWQQSGLTLEAEYMNKHYTNSTHRATHAWNFFADYGGAINSKALNHWSAQARFDGMTAHSSGVAGADGKAITSDPARNRITVGATVSHIAGSRHLDLRLDYEKYLYHHDVAAPAGQGDRVTAEIVVRF